MVFKLAAPQELVRMIHQVFAVVVEARIGSGCQMARHRNLTAVQVFRTRPVVLTSHRLVITMTCVTEIVPARGRIATERFWKICLLCVTNTLNPASEAVGHVAVRQRIFSGVGRAINGHTHTMMVCAFWGRRTTTKLRVTIVNAAAPIKHHRIASLLVGLIAGYGLWYLSPSLFGAAEPWDSSGQTLLNYFIILGVVGFITTLLLGGYGFVYIGVVAGQCAGIIHLGEASPLIGLGCILTLLYSLPSLVVGALTFLIVYRSRWNAKGSDAKD